MPSSVNPIDLIQMIKSGANPQQLALSMLQDRAKDNPMMNTLLAFAQQGRTKDIEQFARETLSKQGYDYDTEFNSFKKSLGL